MGLFQLNSNLQQLTNQQGEWNNICVIISSDKQKHNEIELKDINEPLCAGYFTFSAEKI